MKRTRAAAFLIALALGIAAARGQITPTPPVPNVPAPTPTNRPSPGNLVLLHLPSNAALASLCSVDTPACPAANMVVRTNVTRDDYAPGNGAPAQLFAPQTGTCAGNSLVNDGGSCTDGPDGNSWKAIGVSRWNVLEFGAIANSNTAAAANLAAFNKASAAAANANSAHEMLADGGVFWLNTGFNLYTNVHLTISNATLRANQDGPLIGVLPSPNGTLGYTNGNNAVVDGMGNSTLDMNGHHGTPFLNRAGWSDKLANITVAGVQAGSFTDAVGMETVTGTTTNSSATISSLVDPGGFSGAGSQVWNIGDIISDSKGCIPANDQVIATTQTTLTLQTAANSSGCGAGDVLTITHVFPDAVALWVGYTPMQGAYFGLIQNVIVNQVVSGTSSAHTSSTITLNADSSGFTAMSAATITGATFAAGPTPTFTFTLAAPPSPLIAAGQAVYIGNSINPSGYAGAFVAARGTAGNVVVVDAPTGTTPGAYVSGGTLYYGGSLIGDDTAIGGLLGQTYITANSGPGGGNVLTLGNNNSGPTGSFTNGDTIVGTTCGAGLVETSTGNNSNPNYTFHEYGKIKGCQVGVELYQGNFQEEHAIELSYNGFAVVAGGGGRSAGGQTGPAAEVSAKLYNLYVEHQLAGAAGGAYLLTADSNGICAAERNGCGVASYSAPGDLSGNNPVINQQLTAASAKNAWGSPLAITKIPADATGFTTPEHMAGLGADGTSPCLFTPTASTQATLNIAGTAINNTGGDGAQVTLRYGTGTPPALGAAVTGTQVGKAIVMNVATTKTPFSITGSVTGLATGTPYWMDLSVLQITGGTITLQQLTCNAFGP